MEIQPKGFQIEGKTFEFSFDGQGNGGAVKILERALRKSRRVRLSTAMASWIAGLLADSAASGSTEVGFESKKRFGRALALVKARSNSKGPFLEVGVALRGRYEAVFFPYGRSNVNWKEVGRFLQEMVQTHSKSSGGRDSEVRQGSRSSGNRHSYIAAVLNDGRALRSPSQKPDSTTSGQSPTDRTTLRSTGKGLDVCVTCGRPWQAERDSHALTAEARETHVPSPIARETHAPVPGSNSVFGAFPSIQIGSSNISPPLADVENPFPGLLRWEWSGSVLNAVLDFGKIFSSILQCPLPKEGSFQQGGSQNESGRETAIEGEGVPTPRKDTNHLEDDQARVDQSTTEEEDEGVLGSAEREKGNDSLPTSGSKAMDRGLGHKEAASCGDSDQSVGGESLNGEDSSFYEESSFYVDSEDDMLLLESLRGFYDDNSIVSETPFGDLEDFQLDMTEHCPQAIESMAPNLCTKGKGIEGDQVGDTCGNESKEDDASGVVNDTVPHKDTNDAAPNDPQIDFGSAEANKRAQSVLDGMNLKLVTQSGTAIQITPHTYSGRKNWNRELANLKTTINYKDSGIRRGFFNRS